jgi:Protein of unknown function (DUF2806).
MLDLVLSQPLPLAEAVTGAILAGNACKGVGKLCKLMLGNQFRLQKYKDDLMQAQTDRDTKAIEADDARFDGATLHPALALPNTSPNVPLEYLPMLEGQRQESSNLNANLGIALGILADTEDDKISDDPVSPDWFARWRREAQVIGDQDLQNLWGRILAEEVKKPQTISLITLDVLKCITSADAALFCNIAKFAVCKVISSNLLNEPSIIKFIDIQKLQWANLIGDSMSVCPIAVLEDQGQFNLLSGRGFVFTLYPPQEKSIKIDSQCFSITLAGREILKVADTITPVTPEEIKIIGDCIWKNTPGDFQEMKAHFTDEEGIFYLDEVIHSWNRAV